MYVLAQSNAMVALDAATGKELWTHPNTGAVGTRGMNYWESKDRSDRRLFFINAGFLTAIDARTGQTINSFGDNGRTDLRQRTRPRSRHARFRPTIPAAFSKTSSLRRCPPAAPATIPRPPTSTPTMSSPESCCGRFHVVPHPGEFGYDTWPPDAWKTVGGVHNWNEMTIDEKRGIAYIPLGTARYDFYGANRKGNDLFGNSLLALDARTGKRLWHYQLVHHDLWDYDLPVAPKLLTVKHNGKNVDIVAQATKFGFLFVFDRVTGEPLWPIEERPVPQSDVPGEWSSPTQPFPTKPPPFARQSFTEKDINPFATEAEQAAIRELLKNSRNEGLFTPPSLRGSISVAGPQWRRQLGHGRRGSPQGILVRHYEGTSDARQAAVAGAGPRGQRRQRQRAAGATPWPMTQLRSLYLTGQFHDAERRAFRDGTAVVDSHRLRSELRNHPVAGSQRRSHWHWRRRDTAAPAPAALAADPW